MRNNKFLKSCIVILLSLLIVPLTGTTVAQAANSSLNYNTTVQIGEVVRDVIYSKSQQRAYVLSDIKGDTPAGAVTWLDTNTNQASTTSWNLEAAEPSSAILAANESKLYIAHYRNTTFSSVDTSNGSVQTITGIPKFPVGLVEDTKRGTIYVYDSSGLYIVDLAQNTVSPKISVSTQKFPLIKSVVFDPENDLLWIAEGRQKVLTAFDTTTNSWRSDIEIPLSDAVFGDAPVGGRAQTMALDTDLNLLHILMRPTLSDTWTNDRVISFDTAQRKIVGNTFIETGVNALDMKINPTTHEIYTADAHSNTVHVISPETWESSLVADFTALGVTNGTGAGAGDVWGLAIHPVTNTLYVSHPYQGSRVSILERTGAIPTPQPRGANTSETPTKPEIPAAWNGPAAATVSAAEFCAVTTESAKLKWAINDYAAAWKTTPLGQTTKQDSSFVWSNGSGWINQQTGTAEISWKDGLHIQHYEVLVPELTSTWGNPLLTVNADKTAVLTADIAWNLSATTASPGYTRVPVATFQNVEIQQTATGFSLTATPDWKDRSYTDSSGRVYSNSFPKEFIDYFDPQMRPWFYTTGASMDAQKQPLPITVEVGTTTNSKCSPNQSLELSITSAEVNSEVTATATGFTPGEEVKFELHSTPQLLGYAQAADNGTATLTFNVPAGTPLGEHQVVATQANGSLTARSALTVIAPPAPTVTDPVQTVTPAEPNAKAPVKIESQTAKNAVDQQAATQAPLAQTGNVIAQWILLPLAGMIAIALTLLFFGQKRANRHG